MKWEFASAPDPAISLWPLEDESTVWQDNDAKVSIVDGELLVEATGEDPYLVWPIPTPVDVVVVSILVEATHPGPLQLFWVSEDCPEFAQKCSLIQQVIKGAQPLAFVFDKPRALSGLRIDTPGSPGSKARFREIHLHASRVLTAQWTARPNHTLARREGKGLRITSKEADPWISVLTPWLQAKSVRAFEIALSAPTGTQPQLFWRGSACDGFSEECSATLEPSSNPAVTHRVELAGVPAWKGRIEELRLDPTAQAGTAVLSRAVLVAAGSE